MPFVNMHYITLLKAIQSDSVVSTMSKREAKNGSFTSSILNVLLTVDITNIGHLVNHENVSL